MKIGGRYGALLFGEFAKRGSGLRDGRNGRKCGSGTGIKRGVNYRFLCTTVRLQPPCMNKHQQHFYLLSKILEIFLLKKKPERKHLFVLLFCSPKVRIYNFYPLIVNIKNTGL